MKILILGATGMLGSASFRFFANSPGFEVFGTLRGGAPPADLAGHDRATLIGGVDASNFDSIVAVIGKVQPDIVLNCVGIVKQLAEAKDPVLSIGLNALLPHRLAALCQVAGARLVHISTDCVFDGKRGSYKEADFADADDLYGRSKYLGEIDYPNGVTLRTSIIGHEMGSKASLLEWFLSQPGPQVKGYRNAIFTGLPTVELARVIRDFIVPRPQLRGVWHVASSPIDKFDLLGLIAQVYGKKIDIVPDDAVVIDRSLDGSRFREETGFVAKPWPDLVKRMHAARPL